ncbi:MAG TPA: hypothetical protein VJR70_03525 [Stellaceae bacterium]|nr:hypothetical protein [Stellaceae bacterium]
MLLSHTIFANASAVGGGLGVLDPAQFFNTASGSPNADTRIIYNSSTGGLSYDPDGQGGAAATRFATLATGLALTSSNFTVF